MRELQLIEQRLKIARKHYEEIMPRTKNKEQIRRGSGNIFRDIGVDKPEEALGKARIVETIAELLEKQNLSQHKAGALVGLTQPQVSRLMRGDTREFSYERLIRILTSLGQDVEITIRGTRASRKRGHVLIHR